MGGAAGHMKHPFEVPGVDTGPQMLQFIEKTRDYLLAGGLADTKIDGTNVSFKLVDTEDGGKEFAVDRGSSQPSDVLGITARNVRNKFGEGHGMIRAIEVLLEIFNEALPSLEPELKALGVWDDPTKIFNTEYVEKVEGREATNVVAYDHNFFKIHGINQFFAKPALPWRIRKGIGMDRPGLKERPVDDETGKVFDGPSIGVNYDKGAMESLREKLSPIAAEKDFIVYTLIPVIKKSGVESVDFTDSLNRQISITTSRGNIETKSLKEWLNGVINPWQQYVNLVNGRSIPARGKEVYKAILGARAGTEELDIEAQVPLSEMFGEDEEAKKLALDGAVIWHVTRLLGNDIIDAFTTEDMGDMDRHEGIVAKMPEYKFDVKITGEFILGGEASTFRKETAAEEPEKTGNIIALFPGGFKPPHAGHFELAKRYAEDPQISKVLMLIGPAVRRSENGAIAITKESSVHIISQFYKQYLGDKVILEDSPGGEENPMRAAFRWIDEIAQPGETYTLAASSKDPKRAEQFTASHKCPDGKYCKEGVEVVLHPVDVQAIVYSGRTDNLNGRPISASVMREDLASGDKRNFMTNLPAAVSDYVDEIFDILGGQVKKTPETLESPTSQSSSDELINKVMSEIIRRIGIKKGKKQVKSFKHIKEGSLAEDDLGEEQLFLKKKKKEEPYSKEDIIEPKKEKKPLKKKKSKKQTLVGDEYDFEEYKRWKEEELEETSTMSGGNVQGHAGAFVDFTEEENQKEAAATRLRRENKTIYDKKDKNMQNEQLLRESIRKLIKKKYNLFEKQKSEENKLRTVIQEIIKESTKVSDSPTKSTGINKLIGVLKIILPTVETGFKGLTTSAEQRESYKQHLVKAYVDTLSPVDVINKVGDPDNNLEAEETPETPLAEQAGDAVDVDFKGINVDRKPEEDPFETEEERAEREEEDAEEKEGEKKFDAEAIEGPEGEKKPFPEIAGLDPTGRDEAVDIYKKTKDAILRTYKRLHNQGDRDHFQDYLITNLLLYFDKWESDIGLAPEDTVTTPEYEAAKQEKSKYASGASEAAALEEAVKRAVQNTILKSS